MNNANLSHIPHNSNKQLIYDHSAFIVFLINHITSVRQRHCDADNSSIFQKSVHIDCINMFQTILRRFYFYFSIHTFMHAHGKYSFIFAKIYETAFFVWYIECSLLTSKFYYCEMQLHRKWDTIPSVAAFVHLNNIKWMDSVSDSWIRYWLITAFKLCVIGYRNVGLRFTDFPVRYLVIVG